MQNNAAPCGSSEPHNWHIDPGYAGNDEFCPGIPAPVQPHTREARQVKERAAAPTPHDALADRLEREAHTLDVWLDPTHSTQDPVAILLREAAAALRSLPAAPDEPKRCETCDYGSSYLQHFTIETTKGSLKMEIDNMYEYAVSHDFLFRTILPNVEKIKGMTVAEFFDWFEASVQTHVDDAKSVKFTRAAIAASPVAKRKRISNGK